MPVLPITSKDDCLSYALSQCTAFALAGGAVGFLKAHYGYKDLPLKAKMEKLGTLVATAKTTAKPVAFFAGMGFTFAAAECIVSKMRGKDDVYNGVAAGLLVGALVGARKGTPPAVLGHSLLFGGGAVAAQFFGTTTHEAFDGIKGYGPVEKAAPPS